MRKTWRKAKPKAEKRFNTNQYIRALEVFLIDENGENVGVMPTKDAIARAEEAGFDLVEVNPAANPPVAKIMDFGQFRYEKEKKAHKQKQAQKKIDTKGIRLSIRISENDMLLRVDQAKKFFKKGHKVKIELLLKGRERQHPQKAVELINEFIAHLAKDSELNIEKEQDLTKMGGRFIMILINKVNA